MLHLTFYADPGHGWLAVPLADLLPADLTPAMFSRCSYQSRGGQVLYLEEDCDAPKFLAALKRKGIQYGITEVYQERTFIRSLPSIHDHVDGRYPVARAEA